MAKDRRKLVSESDPFAGPSPSPSLQDLTNAMMQSPDSEMLDTDIYRDESGNLIAYDFVLTSLGIDPATFDQDEQKWMQLAEWLFQMEGRIALFIGDMLVGMQLKHNVTYEQVAEHFGRSRKTLYNWKYVCEKVDFSLRRENLTYSHYMLVAGMSPEKQEHYLKTASDKDLSKSELKKLIEEAHDSNSTGKKVTKFERSLANLSSIDENKWKKYSKKSRRTYYEKLKTLLEQIEEWGI